MVPKAGISCTHWPETVDISSGIGMSSWSTSIGSPAEVQEWRVFAPGRVPQAEGAHFAVESANPGEVIDRGQTVTFLAFHFVPNGLDFMQARDLILELSRKISIRIDYEDQYGDSFGSNYRRADGTV